MGSSSTDVVCHCRRLPLRCLTLRLSSIQSKFSLFRALLVLFWLVGRAGWVALLTENKAKSAQLGFGLRLSLTIGAMVGEYRPLCNDSTEPIL